MPGRLRLTPARGPRPVTWPPQDSGLPGAAASRPRAPASGPGPAVPHLGAARPESTAARPSSGLGVEPLGRRALGRPGGRAPEAAPPLLAPPRGRPRGPRPGAARPQRRGGTWSRWVGALGTVSRRRRPVREPLSLRVQARPAPGPQSGRARERGARPSSGLPAFEGARPGASALRAYVSSRAPSERGCHAGGPRAPQG